MKLNNRGWGFKEMIILTSILLIFLLVAAYYIVILYSSFGATPGSVYDRLETSMIIAAKKYVKNEGEVEHLTVSDLKTMGYLETLFDNNGDECNGYVLINDSYRAYIKCKRYKTRGYSLNYE